MAANSNPLIDRLARMLSHSASRRRGRRGRRREQLELVRSSPLFDSAWYLETYTDVAEAGVDPAAHFLESGWLEGRDPSPEFATSAYLKANPDVVRAGQNPLLHFLEFGQSEGREVRNHSFKPWRRTAAVQEFGPAAPVFRGTAEPLPTSPWRSWHRLSPDDSRLVTAGGWRVGYVDDQKQRSLLEQAFRDFESLSGYGGEDLPGGSWNDPQIEAQAGLVDAWFVTGTCLRMRWSNASSPTVVRAFQHDHFAEGQLALVADCVLLSSLDIVDLSLKDGFSPVLLVFASSDGAVRGIRLLAFPSLCRGGLHYAELLALTGEGESPDPLALGMSEMERLLYARTDDNRLARCVKVDVTGADGLSPMFQPQVHRWLDRVVKAPVVPLNNCGGAAADLLVEAGACLACEEGANSLMLGPDMIPAIHALTQGGGAASGQEPAFLPVVVAGPDPSQPASLFQFPADAPEWIADGVPSAPPAWPRSQARSSFSQPAAVRLLPGRELGDAELLLPVTDELLPSPPQDKATITWLIESAHWSAAALVDSARALSLQSGPATHVVGFLGEPPDEVREAVAAMLRGRVKTYRNASAASRWAGTDYIGLLGAGVIFHDGRTSDVLRSMLGDPAVVSASCALVTTEKRGKSWHVSLADAGETAPGAQGRGSKIIDARQIWRTTYPVVRPPRDLWLTRADVAKAWFGAKPAEQLDEGMHLCTTLVTASCPGEGPRKKSGMPVPAAPDGCAMRTRALFG